MRGLAGPYNWAVPGPAEPADGAAPNPIAVDGRNSIAPAALCNANGIAVVDLTRNSLTTNLVCKEKPSPRIGKRALCLSLGGANEPVLLVRRLDFVYWTADPSG